MGKERFSELDAVSVSIRCEMPSNVSGELPVRQPAAQMKRLFWGVVAAPKSYRARVGCMLDSSVCHKDSFFD